MFTGRFVPEYIILHLRKDLSWALAGRNHRKLEVLAVEIEKLNPDRTPPAIEIVELSPKQLQPLARNTRVIINAIGKHFSDIHGRPPNEIKCSFNMKLKGALATSFLVPGNEAAVHRSKSLRPRLYSESFTYEEFIPATGFFQVVVIHFITKLGVLLPSPPFRTLIKALRPKESGSRPDRKILKDEMIELKADSTSQNADRSRELRVKYERHGRMYGHSALLAVEAAMVLFDNGVATADGGDIHGFLMPSCLGMAFSAQAEEGGCDA